MITIQSLLDELDLHVGKYHYPGFSITKVIAADAISKEIVETSAILTNKIEIIIEWQYEKGDKPNLSQYAFPALTALFNKLLIVKKNGKHYKINMETNTTNREYTSESSFIIREIDDFDPKDYESD